MVRIPNVCNFNPETTVLAHGNGSAAGKGIGAKSPDPIGAFCCSDCHDVIDGRRKPPPGWTHTDVRLAHAEGIFRTQRIWLEEGRLVIA